MKSVFSQFLSEENEGREVTYKGQQLRGPTKRRRVAQKRGMWPHRAGLMECSSEVGSAHWPPMGAHYHLPHTILQ